MSDCFDSIPIDLFFEIFSRLSAKSIARCRCVSRVWGFILGRPYFTKLFMTRSSPRLLLVLRANGEWSFFSSPQPQDPYGKSSLVVAADFHRKFSEFTSRDSHCSYSSGWVYFPNTWSSKELLPVICNPMTGQYAILPKLRTSRVTSLLGFDPIDKQHKVLLMNWFYRYHNELNVHYYIMTLGTEQLRWEKIECPFTLTPGFKAICINGVLYYLAESPTGGTSDYYEKSFVVVCFDVRSEKFKFVDAECFRYQLDDISFLDRIANIKLINYKGKLGGIIVTYNDSGGRLNLELRMWVLEDVEKQEWSNSVYSLWSNNIVSYNDFSVVGVTAIGEIVLSKTNTSKPFYVLYFNPERNTLQHVGILCNHEVFENKNRVYAFVDHVEELKYNIMKTTYAETSLLAPKQKRKPTSTSTSSRKDHQVKTSKSSRKDHQVSISTSSRRKYQVGTAGHPQQDGHTFETSNKFEALPLLDEE